MGQESTVGDQIHIMSHQVERFITQLNKSRVLHFPQHTSQPLFKHSSQSHGNMALHNYQTTKGWLNFDILCQIT